MPSSTLALTGDRVYQNSFLAFFFIRYLDFHLQHSTGRIYQYVNDHVNAYEQVRHHQVRDISSENEG